MPRVTKKSEADSSKEDKITKKSVKKSSERTAKASKKEKKVNAENIVKKVIGRKKSEDSKTSKSSKRTQQKSTKTASAKRSATVAFKSILSRRRTKKELISDETDDNDSLVEESTVIEYYDLPYRYNQTVVKILAQTPSVLFVYWDISDEDRARFASQYGDNFFETTRPILLVHNKTMNYSFEVEINDFANSWYLRMQEPDCEYSIELLRRSNTDNSKYIYISSSNNLVSPNNHVLFERTDFSKIAFKNVKTGKITYKDYGSLRLMANIGNIYNSKHKVLKFYKDMYSDEVFDSNKMFSNPSSSNPSSRML